MSSINKLRAVVGRVRDESLSEEKMRETAEVLTVMAKKDLDPADTRYDMLSEEELVAVTFAAALFRMLAKLDHESKLRKSAKAPNEQ